MNIIIIIALVITTILILRKMGVNLFAANKLPHLTEKPNVEIDNDKMILISNADYEDVKAALIEFCKMYNKNDYAALPRLSHASPKIFVVTFPFDIEFTIFCFAVNFLEYPVAIKWNAAVTGWATTRDGDEWITEKSKAKKVMLFIADDDKDYDNVFLTTEDNIGYKLGFAGKQKLLTTPAKPFAPPPIYLNDLKNKTYEDFS